MRKNRDSQQETDKSDEETKPKTRKSKSTQSRVVDNGYLESDEIIFSPTY